MTDNDALQRLFEAARDVRERAHAPYSAFKVGAALSTRAGTVHAGCNVENASYPEGWCAETSAIASMVAAGEREIAEIVVVAGGDRIVTPCGGCRQRLAEFAGPETLVHCANPDGIVRSVSLAELLPDSFALTGERS